MTLEQQIEFDPNQGKLFQADDATIGMEGHRGIDWWWSQQFPDRNWLEDRKSATEEYDFGDGTTLFIPVGNDRTLVVFLSPYHGDSVYEGTPERLEFERQSYQALFGGN